MPPPRIRRTGHSRKAQLGVFTEYLVATAAALVGAVLLAITLWQPASFEGLQDEARDVAAPVGTAGAVARSNSQGLFASISGYFKAGTQNARLKEEMAVARVRLHEAGALKLENARLKGLLGMADSPVKPVAYGRLIGSSSASTRRYAWLSVGSRQGVLPGMPVTTDRGVVGRVFSTGDSSARVLLLTDTESVVPAIRASDGISGLITGRANGTLQFKLNNLGINPLKPGDVLVTSGAGGIYRPGKAVAVVETTTPDGAVARLLSDPASSVLVAVEPIWAPAADPDPAQAPE